MFMRAQSHHHHASSLLRRYERHVFSVDYALAIDCLPSREDAARWLAIWGVASFIGTSIGPTMFSLILHFARHPTKVAHVPPSRYDAMLLAGAAWMALCAAFLHLLN